MNLLYAMHDREGRGILPAGGWCVDTIALSEKPTGTDYGALRPDINWIVRANWGYGTTGTIPLPPRYQEMADAAAVYAAGSRGANIYIIGNEPNHEQERPDNVYISPEEYARCFRMCRDAIKRVNPDYRVVVAACAPYHANPVNWLDYYRQVLTVIRRDSPRDSGCDGLSVHAYTRGSKPEDIHSSAEMGPPLEGQYSGFYTYRDALSVVPTSMYDLPVYLTEFNELLDHGWTDQDTGVVVEAYTEINSWNQNASPKIHCLTLYRWPSYDKWYIEGKNGVVDDFKHAVALGYKAPTHRPLPVPPLPAQPGPLPDTRIVHPLLASVITQSFYQNPGDYKKFNMPGHNGTDFGGRPIGTAIKSIADGVVAFSEFDVAYGYYVRIDHKQLGCYSVYCHLDKPGAQVGRRVQAGETIGLLGSTGNSSGPHLHLEIRLHNPDGTYRDDCPMPKGRVDPQTWAALRNLKL